MVSRITRKCQRSLCRFLGTDAGGVSSTDTARRKEALRKFAGTTQKNAAAARIAAAVKAVQKTGTRVSTTRPPRYVVSLRIVRTFTLTESAPKTASQPPAEASGVANNARPNPADSAAANKLDDKVDYNAIWGDYVSYMEHQRDKGWKT